MLVILDIDGTLADNSHRAHHIETPGKAPDWDAFSRPELVLKDTPFAEAKRVIRQMQALRYELVCITGREESLRDVTTRWLLEHFDIDANDTNLLMRPSGNMLHAKEYKAQQMQQLLSEYKARGMTSFIFIEDDARNYDVFGAEGLVLKAPDCWALMFPKYVEPTPE